MAAPAFTLDEALSIIRRRFVVIGAISFVALAASLVGIWLLPNVYSARAVVHIEPATLPESYRMSGRMALPLAQLVGVLRQELLSREILRDLINELELYPPPRDPLKPVDHIEQARKDISINIVKRLDQDYVEISVKSRGDELAAHAVNRIAEQLSKMNRDFRMREEKEARAFIESLVAPSERRLRAAETALLEFRQANLDALPENAQQLDARIARLRDDSGSRRSRIAQCLRDIEQLRQALRTWVEPKEPGAAVVFRSPERVRIETEVRALESEEEGLVADGKGPAHPAVKKVRNQLERKRRELEALGAPSAEATSGEPGPAFDILATLGPVDAPLTATAVASVLRTLEERKTPAETMDRARGFLRDIGEKWRQIATDRFELDRNQTELAQLDKLRATQGAVASRLQTLQSAREQAAVDYNAVQRDLRDIDRLIIAEEAGRSGRLRPIEAAEKPLAPISPNRPLLAILAAGASLGLGLAVAYVLEMFEHTYHDVSEVERNLGKGVLAVLPLVDGPEPLIEAVEANLASSVAPSAVPGAAPASDGASPETPALPDDAKKARALVEGLYLTGELSRLRHAVRHHPDMGEVRTILVTSAGSGEGKTTVALGLARSFARSLDHWALLIEADLRRPTVSKRLHLAPGPGLSGHICDGIPLPEVIQATRWPKLSVIPAGRAFGGAAEVIGSAQMRRLLQEVRDRYPDRFIIVDAPPILATPEAQSLTVLVDGVLLVVRAQHARRDLVEHALRAIPPEKIVGVVFNGAPLDRANPEAYYGYETAASDAV